jgi:hypothetical protein
MNFHLAQINIGRLMAPLDDPKIAGFVAQLDPINALADAAPGFVWRLQSASGNATELAYNDDPEGRERLEHYQQHGPTPYSFWFSKLFPAPVQEVAPA